MNCFNALRPCAYSASRDYGMFGDPLERDDVNPFVQLLWERGSQLGKNKEQT